MRIILSPAKKMNVDTDSLAPQALPQFLPEAERVKMALQAMPDNVGISAPLDKEIEQTLKWYLCYGARRCRTAPSLYCAQK